MDLLCPNTTAYNHQHTVWLHVSVFARQFILTPIFPNRRYNRTASTDFSISEKSVRWEPELIHSDRRMVRTDMTKQVSIFASLRMDTKTCVTQLTQEFVLSARATLTKPATRNSKTASAHVTTGTRKSLPIPQLFKTQNKADRQKCHTSLCDDKIPTNSNTDRITFHYASPPTPVAQNTLSRYPPPSPTPSQIPATFVFSKQ